MMRPQYNFTYSTPSIKQKEKKDNIYMIYKFFIHKNRNRHREIQHTLQINVNNNLIDKIYMLNERIYTAEEMGIPAEKLNKIKQINIGKRLRFSDIFDFVETEKINGYCIFANADIFFDTDLSKLYYTGIKDKPIIYSQLRFEYTSQNLKKCTLFGTNLKKYRSDSQDSWFIHSKQNIPKNKRKIFNFNFGIRGCDNKLPYLFKILGYEIRNEPFLIKTYHIHNTQIRDYDKNSPIIQGPYLHIAPFITKGNQKNESFELANGQKRHYNFSYKDFWKNNDEIIKFSEPNKLISEALKNNLKYDKSWNICSMNPLIMTLTVQFVQLQQLEKANTFMLNNLSQQINQNIVKLKQQEGIQFQSQKEFENFCVNNLEYMKNANINLAFRHMDHGYYKVEKIQNEYIKLIKNINTKIIPYDALYIYNFLHETPWTRLLRGKKILIVAPHVDKIKERVKSKIYDINLFPDCKFVFVDSPKTYSNHESNNIESNINVLMDRINNIKDEFDVALLGCNGYSNIISGLLKNINKSSIVVGNLLYMWFGVYTKQDLTHRSDILKINMNKDWVKSDFNAEGDFLF